MGIVVYNTLSRQYEEFEPIEEGHVKIYVCGITPYDSSHIGHARPGVFWDVVRRYLLYKGYKVTFVTNFTDIEDKIIKRSQETGIPFMEIAEKYSREYIDAMDKLGVKRADAYPRASEVIPEIIEMVEGLIEKGYAYESSGDVYFRTERFQDYGALSGKNLDELMPGARVQVSGLKESSLDFALWKAADKDEPGWESPWGWGRPGWHIECSVMVLKFLGPSIDMHGGGTELIFPHHENEIAQSEGCCGKPFANYWVHNGYINIDNEKMSKSKGNFFTVRDIAKTFDLEAVRMFLLMAHYRSPVNFSEPLLQQAASALERLYTAKFQMAFLLENATAETATEAELAWIDALVKYKHDFIAAMDDDINTADAIAVIFELVRDLNSNLDATSSQPAIIAGQNLFADLSTVLGLAVKDKETNLDAAVEDLIAQRQAARKAKDFKRADEIRDELLAQGIVLEDTREGVKWKKA